MWKFPKNLIIQLKRYNFDKKINTPVKINKSLNFNVDKGNRTVEYNYNLVSVINHHGPHLHGGHYTTINKLNNDKWILLDDTNFGIINFPEISSYAYILFYTIF